MRPFLIDTDPGVDDALAVLMCLAEPSVEVKALTVLGGNVGLSSTLRNACLLADHARDGIQASINVYAGASMPWIGAPPDAAFVHGNDGFGDALWQPPRTAVQGLHAALAIIEHAKQYAGELEILALGPLTNIALALALEPKLPQWVKRLVVMGGALTAQGNITEFAEFNIAVDPESAQSVFSRWPGLEVVDWEACVRYAPSIGRCEAWLAADTRNAKLMHKISRQTLKFKQGRAPELDADAAWEWADPLAAYVALYPQHCQMQACGIEVIREGRARGATLITSREQTIQALSELDPDAFHQSIARTLAS